MNRQKKFEKIKITIGKNVRYLPCGVLEENVSNRVIGFVDDNLCLYTRLDLYGDIKEQSKNMFKIKE